MSLPHHNLREREKKETPMGGFEPPLVLFNVPKRNLKEHSDNPYTTSECYDRWIPILCIILALSIYGTLLQTRRVWFWTLHGCDEIRPYNLSCLCLHLQDFPKLIERYWTLSDLKHSHTSTSLATVPLSRCSVLSTMVPNVRVDSRVVMAPGGLQGSIMGCPAQLQPIAPADRHKIDIRSAQCSLAFSALHRPNNLAQHDSSLGKTLSRSGRLTRLSPITSTDRKKASRHPQLYMDWTTRSSKPRMAVMWFLGSENSKPSPSQVSRVLARYSLWI